MITSIQARVLAALLDGEFSRTDLRRQSTVYGSTFTHAMGRLLSAGFVEENRAYGSKTHIVSITHDGKRALKRFERGEVVDGPKVAPQTINRTVGQYTPKTMFYRNNGNVHIPSLGFRC